MAVTAVLAVVAAACSPAKSSTGIKAEPRAGTWKTWALSSTSEVKVPPPPAAGSARARAERTELASLAAARTPEVVTKVHYWGDYPVIEPWTRLNLELVTQQSKNPPRTSRGYALMSVAVNDAVLSAYHWKYVYKRKAPDGRPVVPPGLDPTYPSEHAAMAGAASRVLAYLFPERTDASYEALADDAAESRVQAGTNYRSDVEAGLALGREVAARVIARARSDGSEDHGNGTRPRGTGFWEPPPGTHDDVSQPVEPLAGRWRTWVPDLTAQVRPAAPPAYGSPQFLTEAREVMDVGNHLTDDQKRIAKYWAAGAGSSLPPGLWNEIAVDEVRKAQFSIPRIVRAFALLNTAEADAGVAAWDAKYTYWSVRPVNAIHDLGLDPSWKPFLPTPIFPSYVSGHATYSGAAAEVLAYLIPAGASRFRAMAQEAALSRLYGGIHYKSDNDTGLAVGTKVGQLIVRQASHDGAT